MGRSGESVRKFRISESFVGSFTYQLRILLSQSYLIQESLQFMLKVNAHPGLKKMIQLILKRLESGLSFSDSLDQIQHIDPFYKTMVQSGEVSGNIQAQFEKLDDHLSKKRLYRQKINKASLYPAIVLIITCLAVLFFLMLAVPMLINFAQSLQVPLPDATQRFIANIAWLQQNWTTLLLILLLIYVIFFVTAKSNPYLFDYWKCSIPFIGTMTIERDLAFFCQQLSSLLSSHVIFQESIMIASQSIQNQYLKEQIALGKAQLDYGIPISQSLQPLFKRHPFLISALRTGEESNRLSENFQFLSTHYQEKLSQRQEKLLVLIEPVMLLLIGIFVLWIIFQFYLPIFQLLNQVDFSAGF